MSPPASPASTYLLSLARRVAAPYTAWPQTQAVLVMGSAAEGVSDFFSDLDMAIYYDALPTEAQLAAAREANQGEAKWFLGDREQGTLAEGYLVRGIECQFAHATVAAWERDMARVLVERDVTSPLQKALEGTLHGLPLYGEALLQQWKARAARYPDPLAQAMVEHYLSFFPLWYLEERFAVRDATLWRYQILVEAAQNLLGVLAGLNHLYYSTFQFKRMHRFVGQMQIAPPKMAERLESLFTLDSRAAIRELEALVGDTVSLVEQHMSQIDTTRVRNRLGQRQQPWEPQEL